MATLICFTTSKSEPEFFWVLATAFLNNCWILGWKCKELKTRYKYVFQVTILCKWTITKLFIFILCNHLSIHSRCAMNYEVVLHSSYRHVHMYNDFWWRRTMCYNLAMHKFTHMHVYRLQLHIKSEIHFSSHNSILTCLVQ